MALFGGSSKKTTTTVQTTSADQRVAVGGSVGTLVSPAAAVGGTGTISAAPYSKVTQQISSVGLKGTDIQAILGSFSQETAATRASMQSMAESIAGSLSVPMQQLGSIVAATKAPEQSQLNSLIPVFIVVAVLALVWS
jgi:hypothetical protein